MAIAGSEVWAISPDPQNSFHEKASAQRNHVDQKAREGAKDSFFAAPRSAH
jgi:hypothetical protein